MNYFSPAYVFFVAFALLFYYFLPAKWQRSFLILISFIWCLSWKTEWAILFLGVLVMNFFALRLVKTSSHYWGLVGVNIVAFILLRTDFIPEQWTNPFGLSFFFFMVFGLIIDQWRNDKRENYDWQDFLLMPMFFPLLMSGPLERGKHFFESLKNRNSNVMDNLTNGIILFCYGFNKRFLLMPVMIQMRDYFLFLPGSIPVYIGTGLLETLTVYVELSSYAQMGRGVARMFGIDVFVNFRPIYYAKNPNDFWSRWNVTLGTWIRDYVSFPLMLKFGRALHQNVMLILTFFLVGIWHGFDVIWVIFGFFNGLMVVLWNTLTRKFKLNKSGRVFAILLMIGNGIILKAEELNPLTDILPDLTYFNDFSLAPASICLLIFILFLEFVEEKKQDTDWFMRFHRLTRLGTSIVLVLLLLFALDFELIPYLEKEIHLPVYFKI